jgi:hypothetical protein
VAILRFSFTALGDTRGAALDEIDAAIRSVMEDVGGEPWVTITDDVKKVLVGRDMSDPAAYAYVATQEVLFSGPTVLGKDFARFRDGFRPQDPGNLGLDGLDGLGL